MAPPRKKIHTLSLDSPSISRLSDGKTNHLFLTVDSRSANHGHVVNSKFVPGSPPAAPLGLHAVMDGHVSATVHSHTSHTSVSDECCPVPDSCAVMHSAREASSKSPRLQIGLLVKKL